MVLDDLAEDLTEGKKVLDIGSGNGYFSALLAWCVGKTGKVIGVEHIPQLVQRATHNVISGNPEFVKDGRIKFVCELIVLLLFSNTKIRSGSKRVN